MNYSRCRNIFLYSSCFFLIITGFLKLVALLSGGTYLTQTDKLLQIENVYVLLGALICEWTVIILIFIKPQSLWTELGLLFLGSQFVLYRTISALGKFTTTCPCIGNMGKALGLSPQTEGFILSFIAAWLFISGALLLWYKPFRSTPDH